MDFHGIVFNRKAISYGILIAFAGLIVGMMVYVVAMDAIMDMTKELSEKMSEDMSQEEIMEIAESGQASMFPFMILGYIGLIALIAVPPFVTTYKARYESIKSSIVSSLIIGFVVVIFLSIFSSFMAGNLDNLLYTMFNILFNSANLSMLLLFIAASLPTGILGHYIAKKKTLFLKNKLI